MSNKNDGGAAFPIHPDANIDRERNGMTLRDHFAAKVLPELIREAADIDCVDLSAKAQGLARESYVYADAMLAARERDNG